MRHLTPEVFSEAVSQGDREFPTGAGIANLVFPAFDSQVHAGLVNRQRGAMKGCQGDFWDTLSSANRLDQHRGIDVIAFAILIGRGRFRRLLGCRCAGCGNYQQ